MAQQCVPALERGTRPTVKEAGLDGPEPSLTVGLVPQQHTKGTTPEVGELANAKNAVRMGAFLSKSWFRR